MSFLYQENNGVIKFKEGYCDFNYHTNPISNKRKLNTKYLVYNKETGTPILSDEASTHEHIIIKDIYAYHNKMVVTYCDYRGKIAFIVTSVKNNEKTKLIKIIDKLEKNPPHSIKTFVFKKKTILIGVIRMLNQDYEKVELSLGYDKALKGKIKFLFSRKFREKNEKTNKFSLLKHLFIGVIDNNELLDYYTKTSNINIPMFLKVYNKDQSNYYYALKRNYKQKVNDNNYIYNTRSQKISNNLEMFVRNSISGQFVAVVTSCLPKKIVLKEKLAYLSVGSNVKKEKYLVFFEKFGAGASESAFELFKYFYKYSNYDCYFILDEDNSSFKELNKEYNGHVIAKNSYQSFKIIFQAKAFISSDLVSHIQRRLYDNSKNIKRKIVSNKNKIFLQHGVCLATDVFARGYYNRKVPIAPSYICVSSEMEKQLFLKRTNYHEDQLLKVGLSNMDIYVESKNQPKKEITFLLTWRPWDLQGDMQEGTYIYRYYQFLKLIKKDSFYQKIKINIILHPKSLQILKEQQPDIYNELQEYLYLGDIKDALLASKVLITDYSSVSFFAFAGGTNVVFYWEDKAIAEKEYGAPNILQADNCFGDVCVKFEQLDDTIKKAYREEQSNFYKERYHKMVETSDGNNRMRSYNAIINILDNVRGK